LVAHIYNTNRIGIYGSPRGCAVGVPRKFETGVVKAPRSPTHMIAAHQAGP